MINKIVLKDIGNNIFIGFPSKIIDRISKGKKAIKLCHPTWVIVSISFRYLDSIFANA